MKLDTDKNRLLEAVSIASHLASTRSTLPILQNIYLEAKDDQLLVKATDLDQTLDITLPADVTEAGTLTVPARLMVDYLNNNSDSTVSLATNDLTLEIKSTSHKANIKGLAAEEYPTQPTPKAQLSLTLPTIDLTAAINRTLFASASDETRPILNGLLWRFKGKTLTLVGTDGYRLAYQTLTISSELDGDYILPKRTLQELVKLPLQTELGVDIAGNQARFTSGHITLTSRLLDGQFPAYEAIIPKDRPLEIVVPTSELTKSLKLAALFSRDSAYSTKLALEGEIMTITAVSPQIGDNVNELKLSTVIAKPLTISLNAQYLIDALNILKTDAKIGLIDPKSPIVVEEMKNDQFLYLLMPLRGE